MATSRAATIRCVTCGLEVTGVLNGGRLVPSDRSRPAIDATPIDGYCMLHADVAAPAPQVRAPGQTLPVDRLAPMG